MADLKTALVESAGEIKTGNPVTDVILTQKQKEAEEKEKAPEADSDNPVDPNNPFGFWIS